MVSFLKVQTTVRLSRVVKCWQFPENASQFQRTVLIRQKILTQSVAITNVIL